MIYILFILNFLMNFNDGNPVELGNVHWLRSMEEAQVRSKKENKPILILFQEIPGCITCRTYGDEVLTHPLIVETIETYFIPLAIYNNKGGADADVLKRYNEPAWNNPVVRIVDSNGKNITSRLNGNYNAHGLTDLMSAALIITQGRTPDYLQLLTDELVAKQRLLLSTTYSMYCFWKGEALFGSVNGVIETSAGYQGGKEVVKVKYDPSIITISQLDKIAEQSTCKVISSGSFRPDNTPKYYLSNSDYRGIPMTELQKCRVNSSLAEGQDADIFLSPMQLAIKKRVPQKNYVSVSLMEGWAEAIKK